MSETDPFGMVVGKFRSEITRRLQDRIYAFMDDVRRRTRIFEGRRSVEEQLSEEYHGRFLIELIQNADDACGTNGRILIVIRQNPSPRLSVFNTGTGFTPGNFESLCSLGLTDKNPAEAIGNKGLGFRSVLEICRTPAIYSSDPDRQEGSKPCFDGFCFRFDPNELVLALKDAVENRFHDADIPSLHLADQKFRLLESVDPEMTASLIDNLEDPEVLNRAYRTLPVYELPIPVESPDPLTRWASSELAATAVLLDIKPGAEPLVQKALSEIGEDSFLFLRNAGSVSIYQELAGQNEPIKIVEYVREIPLPEKAYEVRRGHIEVKYHDKAAWAAICGHQQRELQDRSNEWLSKRKRISRERFEGALRDLPERWHNIEHVDIEIAVPLGREAHQQGKFAIYLPTLAKTGTGAWVNAPFYGKIDRTDIVWNRDWNSLLLYEAVTCVAEMVRDLQTRTDLDHAGAILNLLGVMDPSRKLAEEQIIDKSHQDIVKHKPWLLAEPSSVGGNSYAMLTDLVLPKNFEWKIAPVAEITDIVCREQVSLVFPHPDLVKKGKEIIERTAKAYEVATKVPTHDELARLAETAIKKAGKEKPASGWWNNLYRWLGCLDLPYDSILGKRLIWTRMGIEKVAKSSRIFSPPRRLGGSSDEDSPMMRGFQDVLINQLPDALQERVAFLHPEIDLDDRLIEAFFVRGGRAEQVVRQFRTDQVAGFVLNDVCPDLYRREMSKKRKRYAAELFAWSFILWRHMRGEGVSIDWSRLLVPTTTGFHPASESYAGKSWIGEAGEDLERVFRDAQPLKAFLVHPRSLVQSMPKTYQDLISRYKLEGDLRQFVLEALRVWTAPRMHILRASKPGGFLPELCPTGSNCALDASVLKTIPEKYSLPISEIVWQKYVSRVERESKNHPFQMAAKYLLSEVAYIEEIDGLHVDAKALARCLARGWSEYYSSHATTHVERHPNERGDPRRWNVSGYLVEQLRNSKWVPLQVWCTKKENGQKTSGDFGEVVEPTRVAKVSKDLLGTGSALFYGLLPHIAHEVESYFSEQLCHKIGTVMYSPRQKEVQRPIHIMRLLTEVHQHLPSGREHLLLSLWQELFDAAAFSSEEPKAGLPNAALGFEVMKGGEKGWRWLRSARDSKTDPEMFRVWINDNEECLSLLPPGTFIAFSGKNKGRMDYRVELIKRILRGVNVRRLSELQTVPDHDLVDGWEGARLLSDVFPWLAYPALALLAFGRQMSRHMSVSNPKGEFQSLATRLQDARVQYVSNLRIRLDGLETAPEPRTTFYLSSKNLFLFDGNAELRLRDLANPLSLLFERDDYSTAAQLWLRKVEEATEDNLLRSDVSLDACIKSLAIESTYLQEVFQVLGGQTRQIFDSVSPALFALVKKGKSPLSAQEFCKKIGEIGESGRPYDYTEDVMAGILSEAGLPDASKYAGILRQVAEQRRDSTETAKKTYELCDLELGDWNTAAQNIGAYGKVVKNREATEAFSKALQETRWAACGFLQSNLRRKRKHEFRKRWESFDSLKPSESIHHTWRPSSFEIELPIIEWFEAEAADLSIDLNVPNREELLGSVRGGYNGQATDPDAVLDENVKALNTEWQRLRVAVACLAIRGPESETVLSHLRNIPDDTLRKWVTENERIESILSVETCNPQELSVALREWCSSQSVSVKKIFESTKFETTDDLFRVMGITQKEQVEAEARLTKEQSAVQKQTIANKPMEVPEKDKPLDNLRKGLDELLAENGQELLRRLASNVDVSSPTTLGNAPAARTSRKPPSKKSSVHKGKETEFTGYVGEYLVFRALKKRYPHIGLSAWVSGNKQKFFPGNNGNDDLGYDFSISVDGQKIMIEVKTHKGDQPYFELGSSEVVAAQDALQTGEIYQVWVLRNLQDSTEIDKIPNPMAIENRRHLRLEVGRVYYRTE